MSLSKSDIEQAEMYLNNTLSSDQKSLFLEQLKTNVELQNYISLQKEIQLQYNDEVWFQIEDNDNKEINDLTNMFKSKEAQRLKDVINNVNETYNETIIHKPRPQKRNMFLAIAASVLLIISLLVFNNDSNIDLYQNYNSWDELPSLVNRGDDEADAKLISEAEYAFINESYNEANDKFNAIKLASTEARPNILLYLGLSQLELNKYDEAISNFDVLIESKTLDASKGYWYKALVYLKKDDSENAKKHLELILKDPNNFNFTEAKKLLKKIK